MLSVTFISEVQQGQLHISQPLAAFEGKQVLVTVIAPDVPLHPARLPAAESVPGPLAAPEAVILEDTGRIRGAPRATRTLSAQVVVVDPPPPRPSVEEE